MVNVYVVGIKTEPLTFEVFSCYPAVELYLNLAAKDTDQENKNELRKQLAGYSKSSNELFICLPKGKEGLVYYVQKKEIHRL